MGKILQFAFLSALVGLSACTQSKPIQKENLRAPKTAQSLMLNVAKQAQICWFKRKDKAFKPYRMATELNSFSGQPRILIVPRNNPGGLPKLVAQAKKSNGRVDFTTFGPLLNSKDGPRLNASLRSWARGSKSC